jgi:hypothetical protein
MRVALHDLRLERSDVVHGGPNGFMLAPSGVPGVQAGLPQPFEQ